MKVTVIKVVKPMDVINKHVDLDLIQRETKAVMFLDPWVHPGSSEWNTFVTKLTRHIAEIENQETDNVITCFDVIYTVNGIGHFHDANVTLADELRNYHYSDSATYEGMVNSYCCGRQVLFKKYKDSGNTKMTGDRKSREYHQRISGFRKYRRS
jgi:hypothetical protein